MAGNIQYQLHTLVSGATADVYNRTLFYRITTFFDSHPGFNRIASYWGTGGGSNFNNSTEKAFGVWRTASGSEQFDVFIGWSYNILTTTQVGSEPIWYVGSTENYGVHLATAWHSSSAAWDGTTNNNGADTFTGGFFKSHSVVFPATNGGLGTNGRDRTRAALLYLGGTTNGRLSCAGDNDGFNIAFSEASNAIFDYQILFERYEPHTSSFDLPYVMHCIFPSVQNSFIKNTETNEYYSGISVFKPNSTNQITTSNGASTLCSQYYVDFTTVGVETNFPRFERGGTVANGAITDEYPILLTPSKGDRRPAGFIRHTRIVNGNFAGRDRIGSGSRFVTTDTSTATRLSIPWTASVTPGAATFYTGSTYFNTQSLAGAMPYSLIGSTFDLYTISSSVTVVTESVGGVQETWRYFLAGQYFYTSSFPNVGQDKVKIK